MVEKPGFDACNWLAVMNLSQLFNLPEPQFSHLWSEINTYLLCYDFLRLNKTRYKVPSTRA